MGMAVMAALALGLVAVFWYVSAFSRSVPSTRSFSVSGEGKVIAVPDVAELSFGVLTEGGKNLANLQKENTEKANGVIEFLKKNGIEDKDIKTQSYNITPRYQRFSCPPRPPVGGKGEAAPCPPPEIVGYSINQTVSVKIRSLNKVGEILSGVVKEGANTVSGPNFTVDDPSGLEQKAREEAMQKAREKAVATAKSGGFRLGKIISVNEGVFAPQPYFAKGLALGIGGDFGGERPSIEPGSQEVRVNVTLVYEIK